MFKSRNFNSSRTGCNFHYSLHQLCETPSPSTWQFFRMLKKQKHFITGYFFCGMFPNRRTTLCRLSASKYSIYSQAVTRTERETTNGTPSTVLLQWSVSSSHMSVVQRVQVLKMVSLFLLLYKKWIFIIMSVCVCVYERERESPHTNVLNTSRTFLKFSHSSTTVSLKSTRSEFYCRITISAECLLNSRHE
jgi:hypothetical protein